MGGARCDQRERAKLEGQVSEKDVLSAFVQSRHRSLERCRD